MVSLRWSRLDDLAGLVVTEKSRPKSDCSQTLTVSYANRSERAHSDLISIVKL